MLDILFVHGILTEIIKFSYITEKPPLSFHSVELRLCNATFCCLRVQHGCPDHKTAFSMHDKVNAIMCPFMFI